MAKFFWPEKPFQGSEKILAWKDSAMARVRSVEPESTMTISSAKATLARVRWRLASSFSVMIATDSNGGVILCPASLDSGSRFLCA